ncbi:MULTISPECIES: EF-hand domain-containing protein [unclassified Novosphingobium]|uniref:EF-hand domain-containing protein n=1 Tax=unclassified Novosphingobium TaxID=2644732 RepID=UPI00146F5BB8|nr:MULTISPECIES: EF-hand domain-containing protein [unclassified Novosphingobium]NMN06432.1 Ca2+-binding EF-hand superfamily protein [Novosphingobium sp. SG919]NMN89121.1 Ca2+-binding EF-hand superfamily protein [Novosphingobium sp. SG916]
MRISLFIAATATLAIAGTAHAQRGGRFADMFAGADANHDGRISRDEFMAGRSARFAELDRNHDGVISAADFPRLAAFAAAKAKMDALITSADADHDGRVTRQELAHAPTTMFDMADANHDGFVDQSELTAFRANARAMRGGM